MRKTHFSDEQMVNILREADRDPVAQVARRNGVREQAIYTWRQRFRGMSADDVKKLRLLEQENARLKKLLVERDLEIEVMKEIAAKNGRGTRPTPASGVCAEARTVTTQGVCACYPPRNRLYMEARHGPLIKAMSGLADLFSVTDTVGYRCSWNVWGISWGLRGHSGFGTRQVFKCRRSTRGSAFRKRPRPQLPVGANEVWAYDFVCDACANDQPLKCLTVIDEYTRECLAIDVAGSIRSGRVIEPTNGEHCVTFARITGLSSYPKPCYAGQQTNRWVAPDLPW